MNSPESSTQISPAAKPPRKQKETARTGQMCGSSPPVWSNARSNASGAATPPNRGPDMERQQGTTEPFDYWMRPSCLQWLPLIFSDASPLEALVHSLRHFQSLVRAAPKTKHSQILPTGLGQRARFAPGGISRRFPHLQPLTSPFK